MNILTVNLLFSTLVFGIATKLYVLPRLAQFEPRSVVLPILLLHVLRHLGRRSYPPPGKSCRPLPHVEKLAVALGLSMSL